MLGQKQAINQAIEQSLLTVAQAYEQKIDAELERLDNITEDDIDEMRRRRMAEMKKMSKQKEIWRQQGHGSYEEVKERDIIHDLKEEERLIVHFYRSNDPCKVVDKHLDILAKEHLETRFVKIHAEQALFLSDKLNIRMLPTILVLLKGQVEDRIVGLDQLGGTLTFPTYVLAQRLAKKQGLFYEHGRAYGGAEAPGPADASNKIRKGQLTRTASDEDSDFGD